MDSENGRMTRREYRAQLGLDTETPEKREKSRDAVALRRDALLAVRYS